LICFFVEANCGATCQNGGRCEQKGPSAYACVCPNDFIGLYCETSVFCKWSLLFHKFTS